jgi:Mce-associated membrane protein
MSSDKDKEEDVTEAEITETTATEPDATEDDTTTTDETGDSEQSAAEPVAADGAAGVGRRAVSWSGRHWAAILLVVLLVASAGAAGGVYWWIYRPDQQTDAAAQQQAVNAARDGTVALLSYAPETLDKDLANAKAHLTGEFLKYYSQFTDQIVAPAAKQKGVKTEATVARAALSEMHPDNATVLVFVNQVTTSKDRPDPALATSSVVVKLTKNDGHWLISEFNPV